MAKRRAEGLGVQDMDLKNKPLACYKVWAVPRGPASAGLYVVDGDDCVNKDAKWLDIRLHFDTLFVSR